MPFRVPPSRVAAALDFIGRLRNQAAEFGGGVVSNLADRARAAGGLAYEALTTDPNIGRMTTAEFSQAAADRAPTPRLDQAARDIGTIGRAIVTHPVETGKAIVRGEVERAQQAMTSPQAAGQYAGSLIDPMRLAAALRHRVPISELDVYHGTPHRFPATEANPLGEFDASKIGTGEGAQAYGHGIYFAESPRVAKAYQNPNAGSMFLGSRGINVGGKTYSSSGQLRKASDEATDMTEKAMYDILATAQSKGIDGPGKIAKAIKNNPVAWGSWEFGQDAIDAAMKRIRKEASFSSQKGSFYKADLPDEMIDRMLDWDKPLSEQSAAVREALTPENLGLTYTQLPNGNHAFVNASGEVLGNLQAGGTAESFRQNWLRDVAKGSGGDIYKQLGQGINNSKKASDAMRQAGIPGIKYLDAGSRGQGGSGTRNFVVFPGEEKKVRILERNGQPAPERIAQALEAAPTAYEQRLREQFGDFAQAYNLGLPDTPEYRRIVQEVTAQGPLSDDALREAIGAHPAYRQAGGKAAAAELRQSKRSGAAALVDSLSEQGIKTRVETSKSLGSRSTYIYASRGDKTVKIRLSDHLPAESGRVYGTNDIMTTPQHWKAAMKRALQLLEETE